MPTLSRTTRSERAAVLAQLEDAPAFAGVPTAALRALVRAGELVSLPAHWAFIHAGTPADVCYVLLAGAAEVHLHPTRLPVTPVAVLGERALLRRSLRTATVSTTTPARVLTLTYEALTALLGDHPTLREALSRSLDEELPERV